MADISALTEHENRIKFLTQTKKNLCLSMKRKFQEHLDLLPAELLNSKLTIQQFIEDYNGNVELLLKGKKAPKKTSSRSTKSARKDAQESRQSSVFDENDWRSSTASCRRITLQGIGTDVEILLPSNENTAQTTQEMESLDKEELLKLKETLKAAQEKANALLASLGI